MYRGIMAFPKYKTPWVAGSLNRKFWAEVMVGRKITRLRFDKDRIASFTLDNGQVVKLVGDAGGTLCIQVGSVRRKKG